MAGRRRCAVSAEGVVARDEMVFRAALAARAPIAMALSGGYARDGHLVITRSIANLLRVFRLSPAAGGAPAAGAESAGAAGGGPAAGAKGAGAVGDGGAQNGVHSEL
jgi:hypothetical protein